ncbi:MAG TPA: DUF4124 domain-containing protein [Gallionellaceae bacterium]|nr:DUF4124 domain-containing protein [Gallionellaceae bacterium]
MFKSKLLAIGVVVSVAYGINAEAKLYKWVDDKGTTHYGEVIPPEYANKDRDSLDKAGLIQKRPEKIDPAALRAKEEAEQKRKVDNQALVEQQRRDNALLNTYSNENEIDLARDRSLVLINARIESNKMLLKSSQSTLADNNKEAESRTKAGKKIPASLTRDIAQTEARVAKYQAELSKSEEDLVAVKTRFESEKELYRKLKGSAGKK